MPADVLWKSMPLSPKELSLARVLRCGQAFRWKNVNNVWSMSTQDQIVLLRQDDAALHYAAIGPETAGAGPPLHAASHFVRDYFNLDVQLGALYRAWAEVEARFPNGLKRAAFGLFPGIRMLRQEPWETVVLFICSSNNNVKRISKMCDALCAEYGTYINEHGGVRYYSFPGPDALAAAGVEGRLRELGFGYRARYIHQTAQMFVDAARPEISVAALYELRNRLYEEAHGFLLRLTGVGPKVADCICLMALDKHDVVPVDTHVMQIAVRDYKFRGPRAMTQKAYHQVRGHLRSLFGDYAGWAQLVMFAADLSDLNNGINQLDGAPVRHEVKGEVSVRTGVEAFVETEDEAFVKTEDEAFVKTEIETLVKTEIEASVKAESEASVKAKPETSVETEYGLLVKREAAVDTVSPRRAKRARAGGQPAKRVKSAA